ncbi:hypothetical protein [Natrinema ejinorense]|uniref:Uncharacterized protein n=1 Tax=Natrinema ejinorense TaxID=373386 RepID=A0A2A5QXV2_9EURY|nr:hypothetical protein [Natrinema ejinorense]PCR91660.1 hypothetical protein CP557_14685 [Natrinema ejinorense]
MSDHNSRGLEGPDRVDVSPTNARVRADGGTQNESVRDCPASIDYITRTLLAAIQDAETDLDNTDHETHREAARHVRGIRAEASQVGLLLVGPEAMIPYRPGDDPDRDSSPIDGPRSFTTSYLGPDAEALERELERQRGDSGDDFAEE